MHPSLRPALLLLFVSALCLAQEAAPQPGKWTRTEEIDGPTSKKVVVFTLPAVEAELGRSPEFQIICSGDGEVVRLRYFADTVLGATTGDYANYDAPAMTPHLSYGKKVKFRPLWDMLADGKSAQLDRKTMQALFKYPELRVHYLDKSLAHFTDEYVIGPLDKNEVRKACGDHDWFTK